MLREVRQLQYIVDWTTLRQDLEIFEFAFNWVLCLGRGADETA